MTKYERSIEFMYCTMLFSKGCDLIKTVLVILIGEIYEYVHLINLQFDNLKCMNEFIVLIYVYS